MRVNQIAVAVNLPTIDVLDYLCFIGQPAKTTSSMLDPIFAQALIARLVATRDDFARHYLLPPF